MFTYAYRCRECQTEFCAGCKAEPYHLGFTCESHAQYLKARHCRFCSAQLKSDNTAPTFGWAVSLQDCCKSEECLKKRNNACALKHTVRSGFPPHFESILCRLLTMSMFVFHSVRPQLPWNHCRCAARTPLTLLERRLRQGCWW